MAKEVVVERVVECRADAHALWPHITDTERLNRAIGLGRLALSPNDDDTAARHLVKTVSGGFPLEYEERPYEWVEDERFSVRRDVRRGLVSRLTNDFELAPAPGGGTRVTVRVSAIPKFSLVGPVLRLQIARFLARIAGYVQSVDERLGATSASPPTADVVRFDDDLLTRRAGQYLESVPAEERPAAERLTRLLREGSDLEVDRLRPFELAEAWNMPQRAVLSAFLRAVDVGLLDLCWDLVCPSCRTASERARSMVELGAHAHCQLCDLSFDLELDRAVEATFRPTEAVRSVDEGPYCIGGPARTPHVLSQAILPAAGQVELTAPTQAGRFRLFVRGGPASILRVGPDGEARLSAQVVGDTIEPPQADLLPGARIVVGQESQAERHVKLERVDLRDTAATAHDVSMLPDFRRRFSREVLRPGLTLKVSRVALLFTDLTGSTALYAEVGDARAFGVVQAHFELLTRLVTEHDGTLVKTIGDAVMAAFSQEERAVRAADAMHREFARFRASERDGHHLSLKVGVFVGPCYVVTANGVLDYFGQTVNVAARLQGAAGAGELVLADTLAEQAFTQGWLGPGLARERFQAELKGLDAPLTATRVRIDVDAL
jgi:class 3 adenylate cyclase